MIAAQVHHMGHLMEMAIYGSHVVQELCAVTHTAVPKLKAIAVRLMAAQVDLVGMCLVQLATKQPTRNS